MSDDREADADRLSARALSRDDPTGWFEQLYAEAAAGSAVVPWDRAQPQYLVEGWLREHADRAVGQGALVVGCGFGRDSESAAQLGWDVTAFDISATAVAQAGLRHPDSPVTYVAADLLDPPTQWRRAFDLVVESMNVQALPLPLRRTACAQVASFVGAGGRLLVVAAARPGEDTDVSGPPWPFSRSDIDAFSVDGMDLVTVDLIPDPAAPDVQRWRAEFRRPEQ